MNSNIVLIGFMGTGKSAIANCLSKMLPMETVEMDEVIAERARMSISDRSEEHTSKLQSPY